jgi:hypothetical protein
VSSRFENVPACLQKRLVSARTEDQRH